MLNFFKFLIVAFSIFFSSDFLQNNTAFACGEKSDCQVKNGSYKIYIPETAPKTGKIPALIHIHGLGGSSSAVINNNSFRRLARKLGVALVAANGKSGSWAFPNSVKRVKPRNEFAYFSAVRADIIKRFSIDPQKVVTSGFSIGASMVWNLACRNPQDYAGFIPVAGTMWRPQPQKCAAPIGEIYHTHGRADRVFPLEGRVVRDKRQGSIFDTLDIVYKQDRCSRDLIKEVKERGQLCKYHRNCQGETIRFCLNNGAHTIKASYLENGFRQIAKKRGWLVQGARS